MKNSELFSILANSSVVGVYIYQGSEGKIVFVNNYLADILGYKRSELLGKSLFDIYAHSREELQKYVSRRLKEGSPSSEHLRFTLLSKTGGLIYVEEFVYSINYEGKPSGLVILVDKTKEKSFEKLFYALTQINQLIVRTENEEKLLVQTCDLLVDDVGYYAATIGSIDKSKKLYKIQYVKSKSSDVEKILKKTVIGVDPSTPYGRGSVSKAYNTGKVSLISEVTVKPDMKYWLKEVEHLGIYSACSIPIFKDNTIKYILLIHDNIKDSFNQEFLHLLEEIQADISFALDKIEKNKILIEQEEQLETQSRIYNTLYHLNRIAMESEGEGEFLSKLPSVFTEYLEADAAFVGQIRGNSPFTIPYKSVKDSSIEEFLNVVQKLLNNPPQTLNKDKIPFMKAYKRKRIFIVNDLLKKGSSTFKPYHKLYNINSCCALPIIKKNKAIYSLALLSKRKNLFNNAQIYRLLDAVSKEIEFILNKFEQDEFAQIVQMATNSGFDFVVVMDENFKIVYVNDNTAQFSGYSKDELIGKHHSIFSSKKHSKEFVKNFYDTLLSGRTYTGVITYKTKDSRFVKALMNITPYKSKGKKTYYIATGRDISESFELQRTIEESLSKDSLTGLDTRTAFVAALGRFIKRGEYEKLLGAVVVLNPVRFSAINYAYGFEIGNKLLSQIAKRLKAYFRKYDVIAKLVSDKFGVIIKDLKSEEDIYTILDRLIDHLSKPYTIDDRTISLSFNAGISIYPKDARDAQTLMEKAEIALLNVKHEEGSLGFYKKDLKEKAQKRIKLKNEMTIALKNREFVLYYQPYFNAKTHRIEGAEALLRWRKNGKIIPPMEFIPYLEETGTISVVEDWIIKEVSNKQKRWKEKQIKPVPISINISPISFARKDFVENSLSNIEATGADPKLINIEIIERLFIKDLENSKRILNILRQNGFNLAIDDFGTGYSSLSYLGKLPINYIKIDISFVREMLHDSNTQSIVEIIVYLAKRLGMKTIAEGVETVEQLKFLKKLDCDYIQGFLFSKPLPEEEFEKMLINE